MVVNRHLLGSLLHIVNLTYLLPSGEFLLTKYCIIFPGAPSNAQSFPRLPLTLRVSRLWRDVCAQVPAREPRPRARESASCVSCLWQGVPAEEDTGRAYEVSNVNLLLKTSITRHRPPSSAASTNSAFWCSLIIIVITISAKTSTIGHKRTSSVALSNSRSARRYVKPRQKLTGGSNSNTRLDYRLPAPRELFRRDTVYLARGN